MEDVAAEYHYRIRVNESAGKVSGSEAQKGLLREGMLSEVLVDKALKYQTLKLDSKATVPRN